MVYVTYNTVCPTNLWCTGNCVMNHWWCAVRCRRRIHGEAFKLPDSEDYHVAVFHWLQKTLKFLFVIHGFSSENLPEVMQNSHSWTKKPTRVTSKVTMSAHIQDHPCPRHHQSFQTSHWPDPNIHFFIFWKILPKKTTALNTLQIQLNWTHN